jgi:hypothetical protein
MKTLEEVANDFESASIRELLLFVADPFNHYRFLSGGLPLEIQAQVAAQIQLKFQEGGLLLQRAKGEIGRLDRRGQFTPYEVGTDFDLLKRVIERKPAEMENLLKAAWRSRKKGEKIKSNNSLALYGELAYRTHEWYHTVVKGKGIIANDFDVLKGSVQQGVLLFQRNNPNAGYPQYPVYAWLQRTKSISRVISKYVERILERVEFLKHSKDDFYNPKKEDEKKKYALDFLRDMFGIKIITLAEEARENVFNYFRSKKVPWTIEQSRERVRKEEKKLGVSKGTYSLSYAGTDWQTAEFVELMVVTYPEFLLDDYFNPTKHARYKMERAERVEGLQRRNPEMYEGMSRNIRSVLS